MAPRLLPNWIGKVTPIVMLLLVALMSLPAESATKKAPPRGTGNPFDLLNGYWSGGGTVAPGKGNPEKVSCKVTYNVQGSAVTQNMRCASTDYKFNTSSKLTYSGGKINGSWSETTYAAAGSVSASSSRTRRPTTRAGRARCSRERDGERQYGARDHQRR